MILFTILVLMAVFLTFVAIMLFSVGGTVFMVIFADVIVCIAIVVAIIKGIFFKKK